MLLIGAICGKNCGKLAVKRFTRREKFVLTTPPRSWNIWIRAEGGTMDGETYLLSQSIEKVMEDMQAVATDLRVKAAQHPDSEYAALALATATRMEHAVKTGN
jgi:hypothetical protein